MSKSIAVLMTCYNRRETTLQCLERLYAQKLPDGFWFKVFLVDDGCSDGTGAAVKKAYPDIEVIQGDGTLFWCNGMRLAWDHAAKEDPDFYFWLNDDSMLLDGALKKLLETFSAVSDQPLEVGMKGRGQNLTLNYLKPKSSSIIVGSCCDPETGEYSYGGQRRKGKHPAKLAPVLPQDTPLECDTFQGNIVLVSQGVFKRIGNMRSFSHALGDTEYGYRAKRRGCSIFLAPGYIAQCESNKAESVWLGELPKFREHLRLVIKRIPPGDWFLFLRLSAGWKVLFYWPRPYLRLLIRHIKKSLHFRI